MIAEIIQRLEDNKVALGLKLVGGSVAFQAAAEANPTATPAAFVIPINENPAPGAAVSIVIQRVEVGVGVVLVVNNASDHQGAAAGVDMVTLTKAVRAVLLGWQPTGDLDPIERGPGALLAFRDGHMWWQDIYTSAYYDRSVL